MNYAYENPAGTLYWIERPLGDTPPPVTVEHEGETFKRSFRAEQAGVRNLLSAGHRAACLRAARAAAENAARAAADVVRPLNRLTR